MRPTRAARTALGKQTADRILATTARLLGSETPTTVTLDRISSEVGVAKTSILWHFGSKKELLLAAVDHAFEQFVVQFLRDNPASGDARADLSEFLGAYRRFLAEHPEINTLLFTLLFDPKMGNEVRPRVAAMYRTYREAIVSAYVLDGAPVPEALASALIAFVDGAFLQWFIDPQGVQLEPLFDAVVALITEGSP